MNLKKSIIFLLMVLVSLFTYAENKENLSVFVHTGPTFYIHSGWWDSGVSYHPEVQTGIGIGYQISRRLALHLSVDHIQFRTTEFISGYPSGIIYNEKHNYTNILLNLKISPFKGRVSPYLKVGGGAAISKLTDLNTVGHSIVESSNGLFSTGVGVQCNIANKWECFMELDIYCNFEDFLKNLSWYMPLKLGLVYRL